MADHRNKKQDPPIFNIQYSIFDLRFVRFRGSGILSFMSLMIIWCYLATPQPSANAEKYPPEVQRVLNACGSNEKELERFLETYPQGDKRRKAAEFIVGNLPLFDAASLNASQLKENLEYAFLAKKIMPWGDRIPWDIFLYFVLPHRISQEPPEAWRREFFEELAPLLCQRTDMDLAALEINKWYCEQVQYRPTSARDLGPLSLCRRGWGRCEEQNVLFIAAARSVCIPARQCYTPFWQHADGNHAWVEIWVDGKWHFLDAGTPQEALDQPWFENVVHRLAISVASVYGNDWPQGKKVLHSGPGYTLLNTTSFYAPTTTLNVQVLDKKGGPLPNVPVYISVYNSGSLRPVASMKCNKKGHSSMELGLGAYLVSVMSDGIYDFQLIQLMSEKPLTVTMDLEHPNPLAREYHMAPPPEPKTFRVRHHKQTRRKATLKEETARLSRIHQDKFERYQTAVSNFFHTQGGGKPSSSKAGLIGALKASGSQCFQFLGLLASVSQKLRPSLEYTLRIMDRKDLVECIPGAIPDQMALATAARLEAFSMGINYGEDLFQNDVLNNRIYLEPWSDWRKEITRRFSYLHGQKFPVVVSEIEAFAGSLKTTVRTPLSPLLTPGLIIKTGRITTEIERAIVTVAIFRSLGIPARYSPDWERVEVFSGKSWLHLFDNGPVSGGSGNERCPDKVDKSSLLINFCSSDRACSEQKLSYQKDFTLCRLNSKGYFEVLSHIPFKFDETTCNWRFSDISPGGYFFIMGRRAPSGHTSLKITPFLCNAGETRLFPNRPCSPGS